MTPNKLDFEIQGFDDLRRRVESGALSWRVVDDTGTRQVVSVRPYNRPRSATLWNVCFANVVRKAKGPGDWGSPVEVTLQLIWYKNYWECIFLDSVVSAAGERCVAAAKEP